MYKPLPPELFIKESSIHGVGLYTNVKLKRISQLGISHVQIGKELYRTPLGGFINHSDNPNCIKTGSLKTTKIVDAEAPNLHTKGPKYTVWNLSTLRDIEAGEELTVKYTFYTLKVNPQETWIEGYNKWKKNDQRKDPN
tara:strand:+ start:228 stop:644 length:417 start_codon:yes stop_codon:yes gene_type:complete